MARTQANQSGRRKGRFNTWRRSFLGELVEVAIIAALLFLVAHVALQNFRVKGRSMVPTLRNGEYILVDKVTYDFTSPARGDIVVFKYPWDTSEDYIKRIIGLPGDRVSIHNGGVYINGTRLKEPYIKQAMQYSMSNIPLQTGSVVPKNSYFVLGDHRNNSDDSHLWGVLPKKDIIGKAWIGYWPPQDFGLLGRSALGLIPR